MRKIALSGKKGKNKFALIDDEDFIKVNQYKWQLSNQGYAKSVTRGSHSTRKYLLMHRFITDFGEEIDHINGDKLDNRRENLRQVTSSMNSWNRNKMAISDGYHTLTSQYKGVYKNTDRKVFRARIVKNYKLYTIGSFDSELHAAMAYDIWAKELFGEYAKLNFKLIH
jgi:hypothetical protein